MQSLLFTVPDLQPQAERGREVIITVTGRVPGVHLADVPDVFKTKGASGTICGLNNIGRRGDDYGEWGNIRGLGWRTAQTADVTCRDCAALYGGGK